MQIVIDIPEKTYKELKAVTVTHAGEQFAQRLIKYIIRGTPLPKRHGRLIDANELLKDRHRAIPVIEVIEAQTIIEAESGE